MLSDQGHLDEADELFQDALRAWRAANFPIGIALATLNLGRIAARRGHRSEATQLVTEALDAFDAIGQQAYVNEARVRLVECIAHAGGAKGELAAALSTLPDECRTTTVLPAVHRLAALAALKGGNAETAASEAAVAVDAAVDANLPYEEALSRRLLAEVTADGEQARLADQLLSRLGASAAQDYRLA